MKLPVSKGRREWVGVEVRLSRQITSGAIVGAGVVLAAVFLYPRENAAEAWRGCFGQTIEGCKVPANFGEIWVPCAAYLDCRTSPASESYGWSMKRDGRDRFWNGWYAVIGMDKDGKIRRVVIRRHYAAP